MTTPVPNLFLSGAPEAGTTSIASWLGAHPDKFWRAPQEPTHLVNDNPSQPARYRGDGSTIYLYSAVQVSDIPALAPEARFVVSLCNPVEFVTTDVALLGEFLSRDLAAWTSRS